eukprot:CAMPEP_0194069122 /NCGR_PEP_ID=MMETSP0009_2-20130614/87467_1 /TAXON_ID=210454 /ORGANISM="Grammatophora oceanica, Strain CCMP 410" /LENGTH=203 /DNA_ID=CAMNT_0038722283 /DNA_START=680 /DNA_END=1291 /DNA_ORIENTATION=+
MKHSLTKTQQQKQQLPRAKQASNTARFSHPTTNKSTTTIMRFSNYSCLLLLVAACGGGQHIFFSAPPLAHAKRLGSTHDDDDDDGEPAALLRGNNNNKAQEGGDRSLMFHHHSRELANNANADYDVISGGNDNQIALDSNYSVIGGGQSNNRGGNVFVCVSVESHTDSPAKNGYIPLHHGGHSAAVPRPISLKPSRMSGRYML